jgi:hypothetical protein
MRARAVDGAFAQPETLFERPKLVFGGSVAGDRKIWDISPDGSRFVTIEVPETQELTPREPSASVLLVMNWFEELNRLVPTN